MFPVYKGLTNWDAVHVFFDLVPDQAEYLFIEHAYKYSEIGVTAQEVANRIREFIKDGRVRD